MKVIYTSIRANLVKDLVQEALDLESKGYRVFYIAPNSLSFEKERQVLACLPNKASFGITVTRFQQMTRYLTLDQEVEAERLDDLGLQLLIYRVLQTIPVDQFRAYGRIRKDPAFVQEVAALYKELQEARMSVADLGNLDNAAKAHDLQVIFQALDESMVAEGYLPATALAHFIRKLESGSLDASLAKIALVIDGFTRFSAEEKHLLGLLHRKGCPLVVGTYASQRAREQQYLEGNLYQASVELIQDLGRDFQAEIVAGSAGRLDSFQELTDRLERFYEFGPKTEQAPLELPLSLHKLANPQQEIEWVARRIRRLLADGYRYKEIRLLLGDVGTYAPQVATIFDRYQIPFYIGRRESMADHPLVHFVESLESLVRRHFRREDLVNLLQTGLYGSFATADLDQLESYLRFSDCNGLTALQRTFTANDGDRYDLDRLNQIRDAVLAPLLPFVKARKQKGSSLLKKFRALLEEIALPANLARLSQDLDLREQEQQAEAWKAFSDLFVQMDRLVGETSLSLAAFLELWRAGVQLATYRTVPATVDVVQIQSYDLVQPLVAKQVFAIGLTEDFCPKETGDMGLLSMEEKEWLNQNLDQGQGLLIPWRENGPKNQFTALSLLNAAQERLYLTCPGQIDNGEKQASSYLQVLTNFGLQWQKESAAGSSPDDIGSYQGLLSQVIDFYQTGIEEEWQPEQESYWKALVRHLRRYLSQKDLSLPGLSYQVQSRPLSPATLARLYPQDQGLQLSVSSLTDYYKNPYSFYLKHVLRLREEGSVHPDARIHGQYMHHIFEEYFGHLAKQEPAQALQTAIQTVNRQNYVTYRYGLDGESRFSQRMLLDIVRTSAKTLVAPVTETIEEEQRFRYLLSPEDQLYVSGVIDRIDQLQGTSIKGVVDYKSASQTFSYPDFYNGLNSQLVTYLDYLSQDQVFGAMYFHLTNPLISFKKQEEAGWYLAQAMKEFTYKGLFLSKEKDKLSEQYLLKSGRKDFTLEEEELALLLAYNRQLFQKAAQAIRSGQFPIQPISEDGQSVRAYVDQYKAITQFETPYHYQNLRILDQLDGSTKKEDWFAKISQDLGMEKQEEQEEE
ncbi:ATP-dependent nuclease subunit B [Streptococcus danieliae]|uniref:ATP-dependent nuclease subunit B n=1 Tax=Streptococcus danieliae TaxID=747656 RepID=UPI0021CA3490|nr:ATP-dependent nuclease subunit B [Streptococcus danieliae]MCU0082411.1 ATP-dependent nuclease subunit B [Streptococcus danieliae]